MPNDDGIDIVDGNSFIQKTIEFNNDSFEDYMENDAEKNSDQELMDPDDNPMEISQNQDQNQS